MAEQHISEVTSAIFAAQAKNKTEGVDWAIIDHAAEDAQRRVDLAHVDIVRVEAVTRDSGDHASSARAAVIIARAKHAGVLAELDALRAARSAALGGS